MSYCPIAIMEDIGSGSSNNRNDSSNHHMMPEVQFPSLSPHPLTDSEASTSTMSTTTTENDQTSSSDDPHHHHHRPCRNDDDGRRDDDRSSTSDHSLMSSMTEERSTSASEEAGESSSSSSSSSFRKAPPENQPPSHQQQPSSSNNTKRPSLPNADPDDDDMMEIDQIDFSSNDSGYEYGDPADQIKTALNKYVVAVKRRKKWLEDERNLNQYQQQGLMASNNDNAGAAAAASASTNGEHHRDDCSTTSSLSTTTAKCEEEEEGRRQSTPSSLKQRPIEVIMSWMDSFQDHEKIQLTCLQFLPTILESPPNRLAAQADGLASIVLYDMAAFPTNYLLQLTAFHTLVVLLRPLGTNEGMVHRAAASSSRSAAATAVMTSKSSRGIRSINHKKHHHHHHGKGSINATHNNTANHHHPHQHPLADATREPHWEGNGVRVMLDSLRRFSSDKYLQAMGCWAMVNAALYPSLKQSLVRMGGVYTVTNAMMLHPHVEAVQFRGLFALINLVIPDNKNKKRDGDGSSIHSHIHQIARLTILAMKTFHTNKSILNRGCLVLRNLSLTPAFVKILARTPGCMDMLLHCRQVCGVRDVLMQRSARTIMILVQRMMTEKKEESGGSIGSSSREKNSSKLTQTMLTSSMTSMAPTT